MSHAYAIAEVIRDNHETPEDRAAWEAFPVSQQRMLIEWADDVHSIHVRLKDANRRFDSAVKVAEAELDRAEKVMAAFDAEVPSDHLKSAD